MGKLLTNGMRGSSTEVNGRIVMTILGSMEVETAVPARSLLAPDHSNVQRRTDLTVNSCIKMSMLTT